MRNEEENNDKKNLVWYIILFLIITAIIILLIIVLKDYFRRKEIRINAKNFVDIYNVTIDDNGEKVLAEKNSNNYSYGGYNVIGIMQIPRIGFSYPVLDTTTSYALYISVGVLYPNADNLNQVGNTVIIGHNFKNELLFSNLKYLEVGDMISITDKSGNKIDYTVYDKFITDYKDTSFYTRNTDNKAEITLSTCTDANDDERIVVLARQN